MSIEQFDFTQVTESSVLVIEFDCTSKAASESAMKACQALKNYGKIPKGTFVLMVARQYPLNFKELPEEMMNANGWFKMKPLAIKSIELENANPKSDSAATPSPESTGHPN